MIREFLRNFLLALGVTLLLLVVDLLLFALVDLIGAIFTPVLPTLAAFIVMAVIAAVLAFLCFILLSMKVNSVLNDKYFKKSKKTQKYRHYAAPCCMMLFFLLVAAFCLAVAVLSLVMKDGFYRFTENLLNNSKAFSVVYDKVFRSTKAGDPFGDQEVREAVNLIVVVMLSCGITLLAYYIMRMRSYHDEACSKCKRMCCFEIVDSKTDTYDWTRHEVEKRHEKVGSISFGDGSPIDVTADYKVERYVPVTTKHTENKCRCMNCGRTFTSRSVHTYRRD